LNKIKYAEYVKDSSFLRSPIKAQRLSKEAKGEKNEEVGETTRARSGSISRLATNIYTTEALSPSDEKQFGCIFAGYLKVVHVNNFKRDRPGNVTHGSR
jgi:hypothetical protein